MGNPPFPDLPPELQEKIQQKLADELNIDAINREIDDLMRKALEADRDFQKVAAGFRQAEENLFSEPHHSHLAKLRVEWGNHYNVRLNSKFLTL